MLTTMTFSELSVVLISSSSLSFWFVFAVLSEDDDSTICAMLMMSRSLRGSSSVLQARKRQTAPIQGQSSWQSAVSGPAAFCLTCAYRCSNTIAVNLVSLDNRRTWQATNIRNRKEAFGEDGTFVDSAFAVFPILSAPRESFLAVPKSISHAGRGGRKVRVEKATDPSCRFGGIVGCCF